jgi:predicted small metal-binding protein
VKKMTMTLACKDIGIETCPYVANAENVEDVLKDAGVHAKQIHGYTDEQLNDPEMITTLKKQIKTK